MPQLKETLAQITGKDTKGRSFVAGLVLWDDVVIEAAPKVFYMKKGKWTRNRVRAYCIQKQWQVSVVYELQRERP